MALPATDNFAGSNNEQLTTYSSNWTLNDGDFNIFDGELSPDDFGVNDECGAHWNADSFDDDQYAEATMKSETSGNNIGVAVRCNTGGSANYYGFYNDTGNCYLFKQVSGSWTQLGSSGTSLAVDDVMRLEAEGTTLDPKVNGTTEATIGQQTDSTFSSGAAGVSGYNDSNSCSIDDWEGGNLGAAPAAQFMTTNRGYW